MSGIRPSPTFSPRSPLDPGRPCSRGQTKKAISIGTRRCGHGNMWRSDAVPRPQPSFQGPGMYVLNSRPEGATEAGHPHQEQFQVDLGVISKNLSPVVHFVLGVGVRAEVLNSKNAALRTDPPLAWAKNSYASCFFLSIMPTYGAHLSKGP